MSKEKEEQLNIATPDLSMARKSVIQSEEELKYGLGGIVRILKWERKKWKM